MIEKESHVYSYNGPVFYFEQCIMSQWHGETTAVSERQARNNLTYQFKRKYNYGADSAIRLPGKIKVCTKGDINGRVQVKFS